MPSKTTLLTLAAATTAVSAQSVTLITGSNLPTESLTDFPTLTGSWSNTIMPTDTSFTLSVPTWSPTHSFSLSRPTIFPTLPPSCSSVLADLTSIYSDVPTPPPVVGGAIPCSATSSWLSGTGPIPSAYSSYTSAASSWLSEHMTAISSAVDQCTQLASLTSTTDMCSSTSTGSASTTTTTSGSSSSGASSMSTSTTATSTESSSSTSSTPTGAAARETGVVAYAAAFAAAGLVGAAAL